MAKILEDLFGVVLALREDGSAVILHPGDVVPDGVEVGSHVLEPTVKAPVFQVASPPKVSPPPRVGKGSSSKAWRNYATEAVAAAGLNIDIPADAQRGDIIAALVDAQIRVE